MLLYLLWIVAGTFYGFLIGLIPVAGVTTALLTIYGFVDIFRYDPYLLVAFSTAIVVSCAIGDNFASIVMNIPGSAGSAASVVDGFPLARQGQAARALSAAIFTSTFNGLLWGVLTFSLVSYYASAVLKFGIPELVAFITLAFTSICFVTSNKWFRSMLGLLLGIFVGMIGENPYNSQPFLTFGWEYLGAGIQSTPVMTGLLAFPELISAYIHGFKVYEIKITSTVEQIKQGMYDSIRCWKDGIRGGAIGAFIGALPGVGGSIVDWLAYSATVNANKNETFGNGNIRGVIGCEGANNAQKATSYIPTILFGIPGAPFEAVLMALLMFVGLEMGTPTLLNDQNFFDVITSSYLISLLLTFAISLVCIRYVSLIFKVPFAVWFWLLSALMVWSCVQYTGYIEDYIILAAFICLGLVMKALEMSRPAFIIGFILAPKFFHILYQYSALFNWYDILLRPISLLLVVVSLGFIVRGVFFNKIKLNYA